MGGKYKDAKISNIERQEISNVSSNYKITYERDAYEWIVSVKISGSMFISDLMETKGKKLIIHD